MATAGKVLDNMTKHLTLAEAAARAEAEGELLTHVELSPDKPPALLKGDATARRYWAAILGRMDNVLLLDSLDTEVMAIYCAMLSRRDKLQKASRAKGIKPKDAAALSTELQKLEKSILSYAKDLGLTPAGRAQLARKRAAAVEVDPDADLYG
nr:MAG TPA: terminase small subunit [Caudoviricetes sp.]